MDLTGQGQFNMILNWAAQWAADQEAHILNTGVALSQDQINDARLVPVSHPEKVRLLKVDQIPWPQSPLLQMVGAQIGLVPESAAGLTLGYGVFVVSEFWNAREMIVHELIHVSQHEECGSLRPFLETYLQQILNNGYDNAPMEIEARTRATEICRPKNT